MHEMTALDQRITAAFPFDLGREAELIVAAYVGSISHNTYVPSDDPNAIDDVDILGAALPPVQRLVGLDPWSHFTLQQDELDVTIFSLHRLVELWLKSNPNVLGLLWLRPEHYLYRGEAFEAFHAIRGAFASKQAHKSFGGYALSQLRDIHKNRYEGYMGQKRRALVERFGYDCYDAEETEFLTEAGWRAFDDVGDSHLATVSLATGTTEFQSPVARVDRVHSGVLHELRPYGSRAVITPGHSVLASPAHRSRANRFSVAYEDTCANWSLMPLRVMLEGNRSVFHVRVAPEARERDYPVEDEYLRLAGLFLSEGSVSYRGGQVKSIRLCQKTPGPFVEEANALMSAFPLRRYTYDKETVWICHGYTARRLCADFTLMRKTKALPGWTLNLSAR